MRKSLLCRAVAVVMTTSVMTLPTAMPAFSQSVVASDDFITKASQAGDFEIQSSQLALKKTNSEEIKAFARQMIKDHTKITKELAQIIMGSDSNNKENIGVDLGSKNLQLLKNLESESQKYFDKNYVKIQKEHHQESVALFENYSRYGDNPRIKEFTLQALPVLKAHLKHIIQIEKNLSDQEDPS